MKRSILALFLWLVPAAAVAQNVPPAGLVNFQGTYDATKYYARGDEALYTDSCTYVSLTAPNKNNVPGLSPGYWAPVGCTSVNATPGTPGTAFTGGTVANAITAPGFVANGTGAGQVGLPAGAAPAIIAGQEILAGAPSITGHVLQSFSAPCTGLVFYTNTNGVMAPGCITVTTAGSSGPATLSGGILNIPNYAGISVTTNGTSGPATLQSGVLNIPQYSGGGGGGSGSSANPVTQTYTGTASSAAYQYLAPNLAQGNVVSMLVGMDTTGHGGYLSYYNSATPFMQFSTYGGNLPLGLYASSFGLNSSLSVNGGNAASTVTSCAAGIAFCVNASSNFNVDTSGNMAAVNGTIAFILPAASNTSSFAGGSCGAPGVLHTWKASASSGGLDVCKNGTWVAF